MQRGDEQGFNSVVFATEHTAVLEFLKHYTHIRWFLTKPNTKIVCSQWHEQQFLTKSREPVGLENVGGTDNFSLIETSPTSPVLTFDILIFKY